MLEFMVYHKHDILAMCDDPLYVLHILSGSMGNPPQFDTNMCCSGFLVAGTETRTCLENGEWELETSKMTYEGVCIIKIYQ